MAFKHRKSNYFFPTDTPVEEVVTFSNVDGVDVPVVSVVPSSEVAKNVPSYEDYTLQNLLNSGVPLNPVNSYILGDNDSAVEKEFEKVTAEYESNKTENSTL